MTIEIPRGVAFLGGTFDPVHSGHLALAREALRALRVMRVELLPAGNPWQKTWVTPGHHRLAMLRSALEGEERISVDTTELLETGPTYTVRTLEKLRRRYGPSVPLVLLMGSDQWRNLHTWYDWERLTDYAHVAVCRRAGETPRAEPAVEAHAAPRTVAAHELVDAGAFGRVAFFDMPPHAASSTALRRVFARSAFPDAMRETDGWLPYPVARYIRENRLYVRAVRP